MIMRFQRFLTIAVVATFSCVISCCAFVPRLETLSRASTQLQVSRIPRNDGSGLPYGERSRPYRRNFYTQPDWEKHRSRDRFIGNLLTFFKSGVVRQLKEELLLMFSVSTFVWAYNCFLVAGWDDFNGVHHDGLVSWFRLLEMPSVFFTFSSPALSLLLGTCVLLGRSESSRCCELEESLAHETREHLFLSLSRSYSLVVSMYVYPPFFSSL